MAQQTTDPDDPMSDDQAAELRQLAAQVDEEIPPGLRAAEAAQRIVELQARQP